MKKKTAIIVGVGATAVAAVAGILIYKNSQKKKAIAPPSNTGSSPSAILPGMPSTSSIANQVADAAANAQQQIKQAQQAGTDVRQIVEQTLPVFSPSTSVATSPSNSYEGKLLRPSDRDNVYLIKNGYKRWITSQSALYSLGYNFQMVQVVSPSVTDAIPTGANINGPADLSTAPTYSAPSASSSYIDYGAKADFNSALAGAGSFIR